VWDVSAKHHIERKQPMPYVNHYSFHILDPDWGHLGSSTASAAKVAEGRLTGPQAGLRRVVLRLLSGLSLFTLGR
jgi:hypothetical protein